jgi:AcrR family transcriptional regulator
MKAATTLFAEKGFGDTSVADLARLTGAAEGTIFHHFRSKEHLFLAIFESVRTRIVEEVERDIRGAEFESGLEMVRGIVSLYFHLSEKMRVEFLLLYQTYPYRLASENRVCGEHLEAIYGCFLDILEEAIARGREDGSIREVNAERQALMVFAMINGLVRFTLFNLLPADAYYADAIDACSQMLEARS